MWIVFCFGLLLGVVSGAFLASFFLSLDEETPTHQYKQARLESPPKNPAKKNGQLPVASTPAASVKFSDVQVKPMAVAAEPVDLDLEALPPANETPLTTVKRESTADSSEAQ